jgi:hypothetical protein
MNRQTGLILAIAFAFCLCASPAFAQDKPAAPTKGATGAVVTVAEVKGGVEVRPGADKPWVPATVGMKLGSEWEISTGLRGQAVLHFEDNSDIVVQRLTQMKIGEFTKTSGEVKTRIDLKYGAVRVQVKKGTAANDFKVSSPTATASVTGTKIEELSYYRGMGTQFRMGSEGHVEFHVNPTMNVGPGEHTDDHLTNPIVFAIMGVWVPIGFPGYTPEETGSSFWHHTQFEGVWFNLNPSNPSNANQGTEGGPPPTHLTTPPPPPPPPPPKPLPIG